MPTQEQIDEVLANPDAYSDELVREARRMSSQAIPTEPKPTVDPISGAPTGGAPGFMVNALPSALNFGNDMVFGIGSLLGSPIQTLKNMPAGIAQHYGSRYDSPEQAMATFQSDPFGVAMDAVPVGTALRGLGLAGKMAGATRAGEMAGQVGRGLERLDPAGAAMGGLQVGVAGLQNVIPAIRSAEETMAGTYGKPRGAQTENLPQYLETIGQAMDEGFAPNVAGAEAAKAAKRAVGERLNAALEASGDLNKVDLIKRLESIKSEFGTSLDGPAVQAIDNMIDDVFAAGDPQSNKISAVDANALKTKYDGIVNYDSATPSTDRIRQEGARAAAGALRSEIQDIPGVRPILDEYGQASRVSDVVGRGAAADVAASGRGLTGDFVASALNAVAPILTGQGKMKRNQIRRDLSQRRYASAITGATDRTIYGPIREGAYLAEMEHTGNDQWHVGRLWSE